MPPQKYISVDATKPIQLSVKQDGAVDVFEMQVSAPWTSLQCSLQAHLFVRRVAIISFDLVFPSTMRGAQTTPATSTVYTTLIPEKIVATSVQVHLAGDSCQPQRKSSLKP